MRGFTCVSQAQAKSWWLPGALLRGAGPAEYLASSASGGTSGSSRDPRQHAAVMVVVGQGGLRGTSSSFETMLNVGAVGITARVIGTSDPQPRQPQSPERTVRVRGRDGTLVSIGPDGDKPGLRLVTWFTVGPNGLRISWQAVDRPERRGDDALLALLNGLTQA